MPTLKEFLIQKLGLAISNAIAIHVRDAKQVKLTPPTQLDDDDYFLSKTATARQLSKNNDDVDSDDN